MELNSEIKKGKTKISSGDIFKVPLKKGIGYFQFLYKDENYMAGHLIRAFDCNNDKITLEELIKCKIKFYTYTRVFEGIKNNLWEKIGHCKVEDNFEPPMFRQTNDTYSVVKKSNNWFVWQGDFSDRKVIGELTKEYINLPFSSIFPPKAIVEWLETGHHGFKFPD